MKWITKLSVAHSVALFVAIAAGGVLLMGAASWQQGRNSEAMTNRLQGDVALARASGMADMMHDGLRAIAAEALLAGPAAEAATKQALRQELAEHRKNLDEAVAKLEAGVHEGADGAALAAALTEVKPIVQRYSASAAALVEAAFGDATTQADTKQARAAFHADFKQLEDKLDKLSEAVEQGAARTLQERDAMFARARAANLAAIAFTVLGTALFGRLFARLLVGRLGAEPLRLREFAQRIAAGELNTRLDRSQLRPGSVAEALLSMRDRLRDSVATIRAGAEQVASSSTQIAGGNQDLAQRTELQAGNLQQAASSMEQMTRSVQQTADNAHDASTLAAEATAVAARGGEAVQRVVATMSQIQGASERMAEIIGVIDGIAFRTNILALNAAVEAARAGEQGRGFAVVASEVRQLAQRSAVAAHEIRDLIDQSVATVRSGNALVADAGLTMQEIVQHVQRVSTLIGEISNAALEQTRGIGSVNESVATLDRNTQGNAALVEESAAAAQALSEQAQRLAASVGIFRLDEARAGA